jgi:hypothetical protein
MLIAAVSCVGSTFTLLGPARPARDASCTPSLFPARKPDYPFVDIAYVNANCLQMAGRAACMDELRSRACSLGGDTIYGLQESQNGSYLTATVAARDTSAQVRSAAAAECAPPCSPGFACQAAVCVPQCNPACEAGEVCNRHRSCESRAQSSETPKP